MRTGENNIDNNNNNITYNTEELRAITLNTFHLCRVWNSMTLSYNIIENSFSYKNKPNFGTKLCFIIIHLKSNEGIDNRKL